VAVRRDPAIEPVVERPARVAELALEAAVMSEVVTARDPSTPVAEVVDAAADTRTSDIVAPRSSAAGRATRVSGASSSPIRARA
jgi:hypothetical protein